MACVVRYSILLISICLRSTLCADPELKVASLIGAGEKTIIIPCATDKFPQDGVYMYKKGANETIHHVFYYYKDSSFRPKTAEYQRKVQVDGKFPNLTAKFSNVDTTDTGLYWCEFNFEDKVTFGNVTMLLIETMKNSHDIMKKRDTEEEKGEGAPTLELKEEKRCPEDPHLMIIFIVCAVLSLLCIIGFIFVILKVKGRWGNKQYSPSKTPSDSVYEEMKRSNSDTQPRGQIFLNPDYQSTKLLH